MLAWGILRNLENSIKDFLDTEIITDSVTDINGVNIPVRVGRKNDDNWTLPCISLYNESETLSRFEIGSNNRDARELIIIDIYATNEGERLDLAKWLTDTINNGLRYYTYTYKPSNPESPTKVAGGWINVDFLTNTRVSLGQNISEIDAHRHRVSVNVWIS